jgi:hypothetical protein
MIDFSLIWQKVKLILSFFKLPKFIYDKVTFCYKMWKFKNTSSDGQDFLFEIYENENCYRKSVSFHKNNKNFLKCLEIDGLIKIVHIPKEDGYDENDRYIIIQNEEYKYCIYDKCYYQVLEHLWRKKHQALFEKHKIIEDENDDMPF